MAMYRTQLEGAKLDCQGPSFFVLKIDAVSEAVNVDDALEGGL
jgi:hypothetical protein